MGTKGWYKKLKARNELIREQRKQGLSWAEIGRLHNLQPESARRAAKKFRNEFKPWKLTVRTCLDAETVKMLDTLAKRESKNRSAKVREILEEYIFVTFRDILLHKSS
jgi:hypothetical protein